MITTLWRVIALGTLLAGTSTTGAVALLEPPTGDQAVMDNACARLAVAAQMPDGFKSLTEAEIATLFADCNRNPDVIVCKATYFVMQTAKQSTARLHCRE